MPLLLDALTGDAEIAQLFSDDATVKAILDVEIALAFAEAEIGLISSEAASRIAQVCREFRPDATALRDGMTTDGVVMPNLVHQLRTALGEPHAKSLHLGATSQDILDTALAVQLKAVFEVLEEGLSALVGRLDRWSSEQGDAALMAHTRMQRALPFTVRDKLDTWTNPLRRHRERLVATRSSALTIQLGGPVGNGDSYRGSALQITQAIAQRLGLQAVAPWHAERDRIADVGHLFALISGSLGKIGQDVALMAQNEVGEIKLAGGGSSSVMTHKSNPVAAEVLVALARFNAGLNGTLGQTMVHEAERSGSAWTLEWMVLPQMAITAGASLRHAAKLLDGARFVPMS